ncbi:MAG: erythromycin esterase family protein [Rhizobiaceae bacterium]
MTKRLIEEQGFTIVVVKAEWPDAVQIGNHIRHRDVPPSQLGAFARFPMWMWGNEPELATVDRHLNVPFDRFRHESKVVLRRPAINPVRTGF